MAKKVRNKVEQALYDIKKARKMLKQAADDLDSSICSRERKIKWLEGRIDLQDEYINDELARTKEEYDSQMQDVIGAHVDMYLKGYNFERFVVQWMFKNNSDFDLKIWQGDKCVDTREGKKIVASWNMYPDLIYVNEKTKQVIAIECKYRSNGMLELSKKKYEDYKRFEDQIGGLMHVDVCVYLMFGCGWDAANPDTMYRLPIDKLAEKFDAEDMCVLDAKNLDQYKVKI